MTKQKDKRPMKQIEKKVTRVFARANHKTFDIKPIGELLKRYGVGKNWIDPYARDSKFAEYTNDIDPLTSAKYHMDAKDFCEQLNGEYDGIVFDPPYSYRQVSEHYKAIGIKPTQYDTSYNFYHRVMMAVIPKIKQDGLAISFGWNSNGFPKKYGFEIIEIMLVAHGMHHNDTIVTVQKK